MNYNLTNIFNQTNPLRMIIEVNTLTENYLGNFILICVFLIVWVMFSYMRKDELMIISGFVSLVVAIILYVIEFISFNMFILPTLLIITGLFSTLSSSD